MLAEAQNYLRDHHGGARLFVYGQDYNKRAFATAASDMLMKQVDHNGGGDNIRFGDSLTEDRFPGKTFDYFLTNPPFGVDWKKQQKEIRQEHDRRGFDGAFGAGSAARERRLASLLAAHVGQARARAPRGAQARLPAGDRLQRLASVYRWRGIGGRATSESGSSKMTGWRPSSPCPSRCSTTRASAPTSGFSPIARRSSVRARSNSLMYVACGQRVAVKTTSAASATSDGTSPGSRSTRLCASTAASRRERSARSSSTMPISATTRVTVERPLRLRYQMTVEDKARFLYAYPDLPDDVQAVDEELGP